MLACQICTKRPATTHLTELPSKAGEAARELHICPACVERLHLKLDSNPPLIADILAQSDSVDADGESSGGKPAAIASEEAVASEACPECGLTFADFTSSNRFGCAQCYQAFQTKVAAMLQRYHGAKRHVGRIPMSAVRPDDERTLRRTQLDTALRDAVANEAYERAAQLRDEIKKLDQDP